ncbi:hypothetical protein E9549_16385 [Blastococcus sp. MG754426]|uniref:hypothetical protein n=1 Tax=unclassified Blastococcus TaxID=2619396 RepID=UPI001EF019C3|nr:MULTISPECIES: hypothetical protein [unclassified Blastococcus]MCF6508971.1 hypothetical protein [Blastococcus sp. MG754426]MCF6513660.1 hypothetical protein [Blastococcus sp. MG754427]MCF6736443.1 hypothetical protein [Blastococcus sp. KM273129]
MESTAPRQLTAWLVQPLVDAGLDPGEIQVLVTRLGFEAVVAGDRGLDVRILDVVGDRPREVRAAWLEVIDRMTGRRLPGR